MKRLFIAWLALFCMAAPMASAQQHDAGAQVQALLADVGRWSQEYSGVLNEASAPLIGIDSFVQIIDRFAADEINERTALGQLESWRAESLQQIARARVSAENLRPPPSFAPFGPDGVQLDAAFRANYDSALPLVHEFERVTLAVVDYGIAAVRDPAKLHDARQRAVVSASLQLLRVDSGRINTVAATLSPDHPQQAIMSAMQRYYNALIANGVYVLEDLDGRGDRSAIIALMRSEVQAMRRELVRAEMLAQRSIETLPAQLAGAPPDLIETGIRAFRTYPATVRAFEGLANGVDAAAASLERGAAALDVWIDQETSDRPYLIELERLDAERAALLANNNRRPL